jgi:hypothetical protein
LKKPPELVEVPVELRDIENGRSRNPLACPIALACNRLDSRHTWVVGVVVVARINDTTGDTDYYSLGTAASSLAHDFDAGEDVAPQTVVLYHSPGAVIYFYGNDNQHG